MEATIPGIIGSGFNSGPMTGGVIGQTKFHFDVWGDVVNTASRMESQVEPGKIQVTAYPYELLKNDFNFYLIFTKTSWIAQVEGKKYYLLNLPEEERAIEAIARILRYGAPGTADAEADVSADASSSGGGEDVDVEVEDDVTVDI